MNFCISVSIGSSEELENYLDAKKKYVVQIYVFGKLLERNILLSNRQKFLGFLSLGKNKKISPVKICHDDIFLNEKTMSFDQS